MTEWVRLPGNGHYAVVIYTFKSDANHKLNVNVGESLHLTDETEHWYSGFIIRDENTKGIIPKSYVSLINCSIDKSGPTTNYIINSQPPIVQEITQVLREWSPLWKNLYITNKQNFDILNGVIGQLIKHRSQITSGTLPVDELKQMSREVTTEIATGNKLLQLDLVVRDKNGNIIQPENTSTIKLYNFHLKAAEAMNKAESKENTSSVMQQYSHIFIVSVKNFTCKMTEDAELLMFLFDAKECKPITENYVVRWSKDGLMRDLDQINNLRVMFTDLGKKDLERERIYMVCNVVRVGGMESKEVDHRRSSVAAMNKKNNTGDGMRRPFGVAAKDITPYMNSRLQSDLDQEFAVPFYNCDKDNLEQTLRKITNKDDGKNESKNQSLFISFKLLHGDLKQVREENPHLVLGNVSIARKMGFPEVILPGDVRNDLYLTLVSGEFPKGSKTSDKNVEVIVYVCNERGGAIPGVISMGGGVQPLNSYHSVIYYHEDKPQWSETFKVAIPIDEFKQSHIKFLFKHRSSNEAKDKSEKPFAMAFVKLLQKDGTTLKDDRHNLLVYKIDHKKFDENSIDYLDILSIQPEKENEKEKNNGNVVNVAGLTMSTKESFVISSNICSTKLTQNGNKFGYPSGAQIVFNFLVNLLGLLNWTTHKETLNESLQNLMKVDGEDIVKFLQDILDTLFNILMENPSDTTYDGLVFQCLLHIISIVSNNWKYQHFEPVLDLYIKESFSATLAYKKLINVLDNLIMNTKMNQDPVFKVMKSLQYIMRFITRSRLLYMELHEDDGDADFHDSMVSLLHSIVEMMSQKSDIILREQGACLKYLPSTIPDILMVFDPQELSKILCILLNKMPDHKLIKQKIMTMNEIVHSQLFHYAECRNILLPIFTRQIKVLLEQNEEGATAGTQTGRRINKHSVAKVAKLLGETRQCIAQHTGYPEEVELCIKTLGDILNFLFKCDEDLKSLNIEEIIATDLRTISQSYIKMEKDSPFAKNLVAILIDIFRQMSERHYTNYINSFATPTDILDFLMEILMIFKELVNKSIFPSDWSEMIMLQNNVILKALRLFSYTIRDHFFDKFEQQAWNNFFHCAIAFMTQPALQLETFTCNKRLRIIKRYKDMRREMGFEIRSMWFNLGQYKLKFVPSMVENILEMTLIPETELRRAAIPIFFDMMQCEYLSSSIEFESYGDTIRNSKHIKGNFIEFENEIISKLDTLIEGGRGDEKYKQLFNEIMMDYCTKHSTLSEKGTTFVNIVTSLMERLLQYRCIMDDENKENRMICIVNLLDFYSEINRKEMYIRYVYKLYYLHLECDNFTEAAFTLELHCKLLNWSDEMLPPLLKSNRHPEVHTHRELKELLYYKIIDNYNEGKMWEYAVEKCQELARQYEEETFDYEKLGELHKRMSLYYVNIMSSVRPEPEYFRVAYYGTGFPRFLKNKIFVYRGKEYERLSEFSTRILNEFPKAELLTKLNEPSDDIKLSNKQYLQINKVDPIMDKNKRFSGKPVAPQILKFYHVNQIDKFQYSRRFTRKDPLSESTNEFASLWLERTVLTTEHSLPHILRWFPVKECNTFEISPLKNAIETMENTNRELRTLFLLHNKEKTQTVNPLSLKLNGILDPAVMGGITNYENIFFTPDYIEAHPEDLPLINKLKDVIADQVPIVDLCVQLHKQRIPESLHPLQEKMETCFAKMKEKIYENYGRKTCDLKLEVTVTLRKQLTVAEELKQSEINNVADNVGTRSRVSSLTRAQVTSFKSLTSSFNFTASPQITTSKNAQNSTKSLLLSPSRSLSSTPSVKKKEKLKEKRRSSKSDSIGNTSAITTQWYTFDTESSITATTPPNGTAPIFELRQELTSKRPLRSEVEKEKRLSRPSSGHFSRPNSLSLTIRAASSSGNSSNRDSIGTTDSSVSEEDLPPPLPIKLREVDYCNIPMNNNSNQVLLDRKYSTKKSDKESDKPPTPPPKPPKKKKT